MPEIVDSNNPTVIDNILATIRTTETGGRYTLPGPTGGGSTASGAYAITDGTWRSWCKSVPGACQYPRAYLAPAAIQDAVARVQVIRILQANGNILESVPASWYVGSYHPGGYGWNAIPSPNAGNTMTVPDYINKRWLPNFQKTSSGAATVSTNAQLMGNFGGWPDPCLSFNPLKSCNDKWQQFIDQERKNGKSDDIIKQEIDSIIQTGKDTQSATSGATNLVPNIAGFLEQIIKPIQLLYDGLAWLANPSNWYRVFEVIAGAILVGIGGWAMIKGTEAGKEITQEIHTVKTTATEAAVAA